MDYDTASCYNSIMLNLASLASRAYGQNKAITLINAKTLQDAKFILKTNPTATLLTLRPASTLWNWTRSQKLPCSMGHHQLNTIHHVYEEAHGIVYHSLDHSIGIKIYMVGFIDNTRGSTNDFLQPATQGKPLLTSG